MSRLKPVSAAVLALGLAGALGACGASSDPVETADEQVSPAQAPNVDVAETTATDQPQAAPGEAVVDVEADTHDHDHGDSEHEHDDQDHEHGDDHSHDGHHDPERGDDQSHDHDHEFVGEAHVHGAAEGALVLDGSTLTFSLSAPLASLGARESEPQTDDERAAIDALRSKLSNPDTLISLTPNAGCTLSGSDTLLRYSGTHGAADLSYTFTCDNAGALDEIILTVFETFETLEEIDLALLSGADQSGVDLDRADRSLNWPGN